MAAATPRSQVVLKMAAPFLEALETSSMFDRKGCRVTLVKNQHGGRERAD